MSIVSFSNKFIFIKTRKCAGTAIQGDLMKHCQYPDVVSYGYENLLVKDENNSCEIEEFASVDDIKKAYDIDVNNFFKFGFTRNPFSIALSRFFFQIRKKKKAWPMSAEGFNYWLKTKYFLDDFYKQDTSYLLFDNGKPVVDYIGRVENVQSDYTYILQQLNLPTEQLSVANKSNLDGISCKEWINGEGVDLVKKHFKFELEYFQYDLEQL